MSVLSIGCISMGNFKKGIDSLRTLVLFYSQRGRFFSKIRQSLKRLFFIAC